MEEEEEERHARRNTNPCVACRYLRKKCVHNCIFAPNFPQGHEKQFQNVLNVFGIGKMNKMVNDVPPLLRDHTMKTIMYESEMRAIDPVGGCCALIQHLSAELQSTRQQLALSRGFSSSSSHSHSQSQSQELPNVIDPNSEGIPFIDWEALQELIRNWANSLPVSPPLTLEDKKEENEENDDDDAILDLINKIK